MQLTLLEPEAEPQPASVQRFAEKMRIKVAAPKFPQRPPVDLAPVASLPETTAAAPPAALAETRVLRNAEALSANVISAEGVYIAIAGIDAPRQGETCRRLDGVEVDCRARAKARLAILLMDRKITCRLSEPQQNGIRQGRCTAGKIDIAGDLLRQGLARRKTASLATAAL